MDSKTLASTIEYTILTLFGIYITLRGHGVIGKEPSLDPLKAQKEEKFKGTARSFGPLLIVIGAVLVLFTLLGRGR